ncbi:MAG: hypothetical protein LBM25_03655 [Bacteroidales bacterium]|jgi:hypothetical protein|nr:hypothetical protein [Bacteroidales bacterium]
MKKIIVFFALITIVINAFGQNLGMKSIIKEISGLGTKFDQQIEVWNQDTLIVLSRAADGSHYDFYLIIEGNDTVRQAMLNPTDTIKDFKIFEDKIWFCGGETESVGPPLGFFAYASLNDLFVNHRFHYYYTKPMTTVNKMEIYRHATTNKINIVGIGPEAPSVGSRDVLCYYDGYLDTMFFYADTNSYEILDDIIIKRDTAQIPQTNNIYVIGRNPINNFGYIFVRKFNMFNLTSNTGGYYSIASNMSIRAPYPLIADSLIAKYIALAGIMRTTTGISNVEMTVIFAIDIDANPFTIHQRRLYGNYPIGLASIRDLMLYYPNNNSPNHSILILEDNAPLTSLQPPSNSIRSLDIDLGVRFGYHLNSFFMPHWTFNSIAKSSGTKILLSGIRASNHNINIFKGDPTDIDSTICNNMLDEGLDMMDTVEFFSPLNSVDRLYHNGYSWEIESVHLDYKIINTICE